MTAVCAVPFFDSSPSEQGLWSYLSGTSPVGSELSMVTSVGGSLIETVPQPRVLGEQNRFCAQTCLLSIICFLKSCLPWGL